MKKLEIVIALLFSVFSVCGQKNCERFGQNYRPKNLEDSMSYLNCLWSDSDKKEFKEKNEEDAVSELHFGTGMSIRNNWGLWAGKNSLSKYFRSKGIFHPDDMSSIILTSFHRNLNNSDIKLKEQIQKYQEFWNKVKEKDKIEKLQNKEIFKQFNIGDSVKMNFTIARKKNYAHLYNIGKNEKIDELKNCIVKAVIKKKRTKRKSNFILILKVTDICNYQNEIYYNNKKGKLSVGDQLKYNISYFNVQKVQ